MVRLGKLGKLELRRGHLGVDGVVGLQVHLEQFTLLPAQRMPHGTFEFGDLSP